MSAGSTAGTARRVPLVVAATFFMLLLDGSILNTSLPAMARSLGVQALDLSAAVTVYLLVGAAVLPLTSWLGERFGLRRLYVAAVALFTLASLACGLAQTPAQLVAARALQGLGGGLMFPTGRTIALAGARRQDVIGITALLTWPALFAPVLGPPLGGWITEAYSWRWNFLLNLPLGLLGVLLIVRWVPADAPPARRPLDALGALGAATGLVLLLGGLEWSAHVVGEHQRLGLPLAALVAGLVLLAWTVRHLRRSASPVVSLKPLQHLSFQVATTSGGMFAMMCQQAMPFLLPLLFQVGFGMSPVAAGALLLPYFLGNLGAKTVTTPLLHRYSFRSLSLVSVTACALFIATFAFVTRDTPKPLLIALLVAAGAVRSVLMTILSTLTFAEVPPAERGAASTLSTMSMQTAGAMAVAFGALCLSLAQAARGAPVVGAAEFSIAFLAVAAVCALTLLAFRRLRPETGSELTTSPR
jgi:EmrB/QacA subfamily drug resistance transporter